MRGNMQIKIYRGTHQIGGCVTEIKTARARIIIDMGAELPSAEKTQSQPLEIEGVTQGKPDCDGVFITHYHGDHVGMCEAILSSVPVYMGNTAKKIYKAVQNTLQQKLKIGNPELVENFRTFEAGKTISLKDIKITPYTIDHSAFDAYMFLIEAEDKRVLHTGDFRMHGARGSKMPAVFEKYARDIDALIVEGTMMSCTGENVMTEHELGRRAKQLLRDNKNVLVLCSSTNIDSIAEFYNAAIANEKPFIVCDEGQSEIMRIVTLNAKSSFYKFDRQRIYTYASNLHELMSKRGFCFLGRANYATQKALEAFPENLLIYSMWEGYINKLTPAYDAFKGDFVEKAVANGSKYEYLHTSGHATPEQLEKVCKITGAKFIIPIHCEVPEEFKKLDIKGEVKLLQDGESITI